MVKRIEVSRRIVVDASQLVELDDGSRWQIFSSDLDLTLNWKLETELSVITVDEVSSRALVGG